MLPTLSKLLLNTHPRYHRIVRGEWGAAIPEVYEITPIAMPYFGRDVADGGLCTDADCTRDGC